MLSKEALTDYGLEKIEILPGIEERWGLHQRALVEMRGETVDGSRREDCWPFGEGRYRDAKKSLRRELKQQLLLNQSVIGIDFGGGGGFEWSNLAEEFKELVMEKRLELVVTNLTLKPSEMTTREVSEWVTRFKKYDVPLDVIRRYEKQRGLVCFISSDLAELLGIFTENKSSLIYKGSVGLVHEDNVLSHSYIPEIEIPLIATLLAPGGVLFLGSSRAEFTNMGHNTDQVNQQIINGFQVGLENLASLSWLRKISGPQGYRVYQRIR